jgi:NAD+ synthase (glutamine-hydrolysing)
VSGYFLPLSGGADSSAVAAIVGSMCQLVLLELSKGNEQVLRDVRRITRMPDYTPSSAQDLAGKLFFTCYMGTTNSSKETRERAEKLAKQVNTHKMPSQCRVVSCRAVGRVMCCVLTNTRAGFF